MGREVRLGHLGSVGESESVGARSEGTPCAIIKHFRKATR